MKLQRFLLIAIFLCVFLSLAATLISYNFRYSPLIYDVHRVYAGWPLYWIVAETSLWGEPPYSPTYHFQPVNFLVDIVFWTLVFQLPSVTLLLLKEARKARAEVEISQK